jgi:predicted alpha-1,2-mannosidase
MPDFFVRFCCCACLATSAAVSATPQRAKEPVDYVDPYIGSIGHLLTSTQPTVQYPFGMVRLAPLTPARSGDRYFAHDISGFPAGAATLMATTGEPDTDLTKSASSFDHDQETATPYYWSAMLERYGIEAEATVTEHAAYYRFTFPANGHSHLLMRDSGSFEVTGPAAVAGQSGGGGGRGGGGRGGVTTYFYAEFSKPLGEYSTWQGSTMGHESKLSGANIGLITNGATAKGEKISVRIGISDISIEQAHKSLQEEIPEWGFDQVKARARAVWSRELGKIAITGGTEKQRTIFYTALYRSLGRMTDYTEDGKYYSGYDQQVHDAGGHDFYAGDGLWDTYRSMHPLQLILDPKRQQDMVRSYIRMYEQGGWLPSFPTIAADSAVMIGHHSSALIADTYAKGYRDFDVEKAYEGMKKNAMEATMLPWRRGPLTELDRVYLEKGFFPALAKGETETVAAVNPGERRQATGVTLENCYDDWCVAQMAKALKKDDDYAYFMKRAHNYQNVFDPRIGFMSAKSADGKWVEGLDPKMGGGQGGRDYFTECNSWIYTFQVPHDVAGLANLLGGREKLAAKLDALFTEPAGSKYSFLGQFPDMTGLIGMYAQGNEPSFHIPYLYNYCGQPWKTQRRLREIMDIWYTDTPLGICGDDDGGAMSSWYVLTAMGFYPVTPGLPVYVMGSPIFAETRISLEKGKVFTITARNVSARNKYIQSAVLNGKPLNKPWFEHSDMAGGGTLVLVMGPQPNTAWGSAPEAAPPSMSK